MTVPLWFYVASPWIGIALTAAVVVKLIQIGVFPGSAWIKAFMQPTVTGPTPEELAREAATIAQLKATGYRIQTETVDDGKPIALPRRVIHPITVFEPEREAFKAAAKRRRLANPDEAA